MNMFRDGVPFIVSLAINSLLLGLVVSGGTAMALQLIRNSFPRFRYALAVTAFVIAASVPVAITLAKADEPQSSPITFTNSDEYDSTVIGPDSDSLTELNSDAAGPGRTVHSPRTNVLNDLALYVGSSWLGTLFSVIWILISIYLLAREISGYRRLKNERKRWRLANAEQRERFFCPDSVKLYFAEEGLFTTGFFSSAIVLPHQFPDDLTRLSIRGIVFHEIAHAKWRDACVNSLLRLLRGLFWINPSLWFLHRIIGAEREAAADRSALSSLSNSGEATEANVEYATAIVSIAKLSATGLLSQKRPFAAMHFGKAANLENRIHRILNVGSQSNWVRLSFGFAVFLTSVLTLTIIPVASIQLTKAQQVSPDTLSADLILEDLRPNIRWNNFPATPTKAGEASANAVGDTSSSKTQKRDDPKRQITPAAQIVEQNDLKVNEVKTQVDVPVLQPKIQIDVPIPPRIQINIPAPEFVVVSAPVVRPVYRTDLAKPVIRVVKGDTYRDINFDIHLPTRLDIHRDIHCPRGFEVFNGDCRRLK